MVSMLSEVKENDLETFKKYIEDDTNGFKDIVSDIKYTYDTPMYVFNENAAGGTQQVNPSIMMRGDGIWRYGRIPEILVRLHVGIQLRK